MGNVWLGELLADSDKAYYSATHLSWGEITVGSIANPSMLQIHLRDLNVASSPRLICLQSCKLQVIPHSSTWLFQDALSHNQGSPPLCCNPGGAGSLTEHLFALISVPYVWP